MITLRRITLLLAIAAVLSGGGAGRAAADDGSPDPNYTVYGGCSLDGTTIPSALCRKGDRLGAFFRSEVANVRYDVCVRFPHGRRLCATEQEALAGVLYVNKITSSIEGVTTITWWVNSARVGSWNFSLYPDPVVSEFGVSPLIISRTHRLFGLLVKNADENVRVRAWRQCRSSCPLPLKLVGTRGGNRRFVVKGPKHRSTFSFGEILYVLVDSPGGTDGHGSRLWGRLYTAKLVHDPRGGAKDTAVRRVGGLLCVPPGADFRRAQECDKVR